MCSKKSIGNKCTYYVPFMAPFWSNTFICPIYLISSTLCWQHSALLKISGTKGTNAEMSSEVKSCNVNAIASSRQKHQHLLDGRRGGWSRISEAAELAMLTGQVRRSLSLEAVRSQARCLLSRLSGLGAGAAAAARRRAWAGNEERRMERERRAYNLSLGQGRCPLRRGQFLLA